MGAAFARSTPPFSSSIVSSTWRQMTSARNNMLLPNGIFFFTLHSRFSGHSLIKGGFNLLEGVSVKLVFAHLSTSLPDIKPKS